jgi:hypothetical protein
MALTTALVRVQAGVGFLSHLRSLRVTMSQKFSVPQAASFVLQVLKRDTRPRGRISHLAGIRSRN